MITNGLREFCLFYPKSKVLKHCVRVKLDEYAEEVLEDLKLIK